MENIDDNDSAVHLRTYLIFLAVVAVNLFHHQETIFLLRWEMEAQPVLGYEPILFPNFVPFSRL